MNIEEWNCFKCTYLNTPQASECVMCGNAKSLTNNDWDCAFCTFKNKSVHSTCAMCNNTKSAKDTNNKHISSLKLSDQPPTIKYSDLSVFKKETNSNKLTCNKNSYKNCMSMNRLLVGLKYYSILNIIDNENDREFFTEFMRDIYYELINDYVHFNKCHTHELENINNDLINNNILSFSQCEISSCSFAFRHYDTETTEHNLDDSLNFDKQTMDSLHFYLFHCYDIGIRTQKQDEKQQGEDNEDQYFDVAFSAMNKITSERWHIRKKFDRLSAPKNTKFNIQTQEEEIENDNDDTTFLDTIYEHLQSKLVQNKEIKNLNQFITYEEYDTDSIVYDMDIKDGNIAKNICNDLIQKLQNFMPAKLRGPTFSVGFRFYYWEYYKKRKQLDREEQVVSDVQGIEINNYNTHDGCDICDLFISPRYSSFKEEICFYQYITMKEYKKEAIVKVSKYCKSNIAKQTKAVNMQHPYCFPYIQHYGIKAGDDIKFGHLLSIVFYCDYSDLCSDFTSTFRKKSRYETISNIKRRNSEYYWLSKYLREVVEVYGQCSGDDGYTGSLIGPFYSGMNVILHLTEFNIRLSSPTSTSAHIEVAITFSTEEGIILQFNNERHRHSFLRCFDVSWLSRYKEEAERLFFGGFYSIQVESVRVRNTKQNFEDFIYSLYYLDTILTGGQQKGLTISKNNVSIIKKLFANSLKPEALCKLDTYICDTFACYTQSKTQIVLDLRELHDNANAGFKDLLMYKLVQLNRIQMYEWKDLMKIPNKPHMHGSDPDIVRADTDVANLFFVSELLAIFKNVNTVIIQTTDLSGQIFHTISMICLLSVIKSGTLNKLIIKANTYWRKYNWIYSLWCSNEKRLKKCYDENNYDISIKKVDLTKIGYSDEYWFVIIKK